MPLRETQKRHPLRGLDYLDLDGGWRKEEIRKRTVGYLSAAAIREMVAEAFDDGVDSRPADEYKEAWEEAEHRAAQAEMEIDRTEELLLSALEALKKHEPEMAAQIRQEYGGS